MLRAFVRKILATQPVPVQSAARTLLKEIRMARAVRHASRQFEALRNKKNLKVHLGCGGELKSGWINVDLNVNGLVPLEQTSDTMFILYDLRTGTLPLDNKSCALRALQPGGTFRAGLPHFRQLFRAYLDADQQFFNLGDLRQSFPDRAPETLSLVDWVNLGVYEWGDHKFIYDEEKICLVLHHVGFRSAEIVPYREGLDPASEIRQRCLFYVEAVK